MTYQEVKAWLGEQTHYFSTPEDAERDQECRKVIIEALERQIPKKVDTGKSRIFGCKLCGYGMCDVYIDDELNYPMEPMFCPHCGQAIDWGED